MNAAQTSDMLQLLGDTPAVVAGLRRLIIALAISGKLGATVEADGPERFLGGLLRSANDGGQTRPRAWEVNSDDVPTSLSRPEHFVRLGAVARIEKGKTGIHSATPGEYPLVVTAANRLTCDHYDFEGNAAIVPLVSSAGHGKASLQRLHYETGRFALGTILAAIFPHDPEILSARFVFEYLSAFKDDLLVSRMIGTANVTLTIGKLSEVPIPVVDPTAQQTVDELMVLCDNIEAARAAREAARDRLAAASLARLNAPHPDNFQADAHFAFENLAALTSRANQIKLLRRSILNLAVRGKLATQDLDDEPATELLKRVAAGKAQRKCQTGDARIKLAFDPKPEDLPVGLPTGWMVQSFENLFLFIDYRGNTPPKTESGIPLITAKNIRMGYLNREPREYVSPSTFKTWMTRGLPERGDLFFTTEAPLANICVNDIDEPFALAQRVICLHPYAEIDTKFLMFTLMSDVMQSLVDAHATGMTAKGIKAANLKPLPIPIPPLTEQHRIVAKVDELMTLCDRLEASLTTGEATRRRLLDALLAQALTPIDAREVAAVA